MLLYSLAIFILFLLLIISCHYIKKSKTNHNSPPGPRPLPIIGNLHQLSPLAHQSFYHLSRIYGPIFQLNLGRVRAIVVSSPAVAEQVLRTHDLACCSRPPLVASQEYSFNGCDIAAAAYGEHWRNLRKIFMLELLSSRKLASSAAVREEETRRMIQSIKARQEVTNSPVINITEHAIRLSNSIICRVALGHQDGGEYGKRSRFREILEEANALTSGFFVADYFPGFGWIDVLTGKMRRLKTSSKELDVFFQQVIDRHLQDKESKNESSREDIVDVMLNLRREGEDLSMDHIKGAIMVLDIFCKHLLRWGQ